MQPSDTRHHLDGRLDERELPENDIYVQEFFFWCFNLLTRDPATSVRRALEDSQQGYTYIRFNLVPRISRDVLSSFLDA